MSAVLVDLAFIKNKNATIYSMVNKLIATFFYTQRG
jgi:hypothetical protein